MLAELKSENHRLKREVARLTRELEKVAHILEQKDDEEVHVDAVAVYEPKDLIVGLCPMCSGDQIKIIDLGIKQFKVCVKCTWRMAV